MLLIFALIISISQVNCAIVESAFVSKYYEDKAINKIVTFGCWNEKDIFDYSHQLTKGGLRISYTAIENELNMEDILKVNYYRIGIILDLDCSRSMSILNQFSAARLPFNESYHWLIITSELEVPSTAFHELPLTIESELTIASTDKSTYTLFDVYNHSYRHGGKLNVTKMGYWNKEDGLSNFLTQYKYKRRQDLHGLTLNVSTTLFNKPEPDLETYLNTPVKPHQDSLIRFHYALVLYLRDIYNFTINLKMDTSWGYLVNGTFTGILGDMAKGVADIGAASFQMKPERMDVCEYTVETLTSRLYFFFRHPKKNSIRNQFLEPFLENVWWIILAFSIVIWFLLLASVVTEKVYEPEKQTETYLDSSSEMALTTLASLSQQGVSRDPNSFSGRITFLILFLWSLMVYQFYSAAIVGSLLAPQKKFINNIYDLANSDLQIGIEDRPYMPDYFRTTSDPASLYLQEKKMRKLSKEKLYKSPQDGLLEVMKGGHAFYLDSATAYKIIEEKFSQAQICELSQILMALPKPMFIVTSKRSPFKKMVKYGLRQMVEHGLTKRLASIFIHRKPSCPESFQSQPMPIELQEFSPAVIMVIGALILATFITIGEHLATRFTRNRIRSCAESVEPESEIEETLSSKSIMA